jgi:hypothetical protein
MNKHHILAEIKRTAAANNGVALGVSRFSQETGIKADVKAFKRRKFM